MTAFAHQSPLSPRGYRPYSASGWADGISGASNGRPQAPALLAGYGPNRPPWNVAGVDYRVGVPEGLQLTDWRTLTDPRLSINLTSGLIRLDTAFTTPTIVLDKIDFSTGVGAEIYNPPSGGPTNVTIKRSKFGFPVRSGATGNCILDQGGALFNIIKCEFNGLNSNQSTFIGIAGTLSLTYNYFKNASQHIVEFIGTSTTATVQFLYNFIDDAAITPYSHMNYLQWGCGSSTLTMKVNFNTSYQKSLGGAEGYQFYSQASGNTMASPSFANNIMIARSDYTGALKPVPVTVTIASPAVFTFSLGNTVAPNQGVILGGLAMPGGFTAGTTYYAVSIAGANFQLSATPSGSGINSTTAGQLLTATLVQPGPQTMSNMVNGGGTPDTITKTGGVNSNNLFDLSGALVAAYYVATMTPARGWTSTNNRDLNSGALIVPA